MNRTLPAWLTPMLSDPTDLDSQLISVIREVAPGNEDIVCSWAAMLGCFRDTYHVPGSFAWYHPDTASRRGWVLMSDGKRMLLDEGALPMEDEP